MNVLLTAGGRRNYLVQYFQRAVGGRGQVLTCDSDAEAPALLEADQAFVVPKFDHPGYVDALLTVCARHQVRLLLSVNDLELASLSENSGRFREAGTIPLISSPAVIARCQDKWETYRWLMSQGIPTPQTFLSLEMARGALYAGAVAFPLIVKPRWGTSSIAVECVESHRQLALAYEWGQNQVSRSIVAQLHSGVPGDTMLVQEWIAGHEYGLDIVNDLTGRHVGTLARRKLVMRVGNTDRAVTVHEPRLTRLGESIGQRLAHLGSLDCDLIDGDRELKVLDLNPRLGGGYPFSHLAGANLPAVFLAWAAGEAHNPAWLAAEPGVTCSRYDGIQVVSRLPAAPADGHAMMERMVND
jgi:carbamoyl-phosphate synthase large subunit